MSTLTHVSHVNIMRLASSLILMLLSACSGGYDSSPRSGTTTVQVLAGGTDCLVDEHRVPCTKVARHLTDERRIERSERITVLVLEDDGPTAARQALVAYELQGAGFTQVEMRTVRPSPGPGSGARGRG